MARSDALADFAARMVDVRGRAKLDAAAVEVFAAFAAVGVDALLLKGAALAQLLYTEGEVRGYSDVDVLVAPSDLPRAGAALRDAGYIDVSDRLGIEDVAGVVHDMTWVGPDPEGHQMIDLHLRLPGAHAPATEVWLALAARRGSIELGGREVPVLRRDGLALHVAMHAAQHGAGHAKGLADLRLALERWPEAVWRGAAELAAEIEADAAFAAGLLLVPEGRLLARRLDLRAEGSGASAPADRRERPRGTFHLQALAEADGVRSRLQVLRRALLPRRAWIIHAYPWARGGRLQLIVAYGRHVARAPRWALRAWRFRRRERAAG